MAHVARHENLITTDAGRDVIVYDQEQQTIHTLNALSALVWRSLDGQQNVPALLHTAQEKLDPKVTKEAIELALAQLSEAGLLEEGAPLSIRSRGSRRAFMKRSAVAGGVLLPAIASVSTPSASMASSPDCVMPVLDTCEGATTDRACCTDTRNCMGYCSDSICNPLGLDC